MIAAFARAARVLAGRAVGRSLPDRRAARGGLRQATLWRPQTSRLLRRYRDGDAAIDGYAEDYAYLILGLLELFQADGDPEWLDWAVELQRKQDELFWDDADGGWFSTTGEDPTVLLRLKEDYDGAEPAPSSVSVLNLIALNHLGADVTLERAERTLGALRRTHGRRGARHPDDAGGSDDVARRTCPGGDCRRPGCGGYQRASHGSGAPLPSVHGDRAARSRRAAGGHRQAAAVCGCDGAARRPCDGVRVPGLHLPGARHGAGCAGAPDLTAQTIAMPVTVRFNDDRSRAAFTVSHPKGNIITDEIVRALRAGLESIAQNPHLKLVTIEGAGGDFSFGASIPEHVPEQIAAVLPEMHALVDDLLDVPAATAAVVRGRCLGGGFELALACDLIFCSPDATFGLPEIRLGVFPPAGSILLPLRVGTARSMPALLTGESGSAEAWQSAGLVEVLAGAGELDAAVDRWFERHLAGKSAAALRHAAIAGRSVLRAQVRALLPDAERLYLQELMQTHDAREGIDAFLQKRPPSWQDR